MGKWLGKLIVVFYLVQWYTIIPIVLRQFTDLIESLVLQRTPTIPIIALMVALMVYAIMAGKLEGIGRMSELLGPLIFLMVLVVLFVNCFNIRFENILPILVEHRPHEIFLGSLAPASYLGHAIEVVMLVPFLTDARKGAKYTIYGVLLPCIIVFFAMIMILFAIGPNVGDEHVVPVFRNDERDRDQFCRKLGRARCRHMDHKCVHQTDRVLVHRLIRHRTIFENEKLEDRPMVHRPDHHRIFHLSRSRRRDDEPLFKQLLDSGCFALKYDRTPAAPAYRRQHTEKSNLSIKPLDKTLANCITDHIFFRV